MQKKVKTPNRLREKKIDLKGFIFIFLETDHTVIITKVRRMAGIFSFSVFRTVENMEDVKDGGKIRDKRRLEKNFFLSVNF